MNKMNKKGFTLIEMLVVIAIIAILVSIIIPVVSSSTEKAACAANAANLRAVKAEVTIKVLTEDYNTEGEYKSGPTSNECDLCDGGLYPVVAIDDDTKEVTVTYNNVKIAQFAAGAGNEDIDATPEAKTCTFVTGKDTDNKDIVCGRPLDAEGNCSVAEHNR